MPEPIILIIGTLGGTALGFLLSVLYGRQQERKKQRNESLRNHFKRFQESTIKPIMNALKRVSNEAGVLIFQSGSEHYMESRLHKNYSDYGIFKIHFPSQANQIETIYNDYETHNRKIENFKKELAKTIEVETGLKLQAKGSIKPYVYTHTTEFLYRTLYQIAEAKLSQTSRRVVDCDFSDAVIVKTGKVKEGWRLKHRHPLMVTHYAELLSENEAKRCQQRLTKLQNSSDLQEKTGQLYSEAIDLEQAMKRIAG
jgi:hypothetical protein